MRGRKKEEEGENRSKQKEWREGILVNQEKEKMGEGKREFEVVDGGRSFGPCVWGLVTRICNMSRLR